MMHKKLQQPSSPKLPQQLDDWREVTDEILEIEKRAIASADWSNVRRLELEGCKVQGVSLAAADLEKCNLSDCLLRRVEGAGVHAPEAALLRIAMQDCRMTGADLGQALLEDCVLKGVKLDDIGLRFAVLKRVRFENCVLHKADFSGAKLTNVSFSGCELDGANFDGVTCLHVDLRDENVASIKGVLSLKGATFSSDQLVQLAPLLAAEAGLDVDYET